MASLFGDYEHVRDEYMDECFTCVGEHPREFSSSVLELIEVFVLDFLQECQLPLER